VGIPVIVNAHCAATVEHCEDSAGGLSFASYAEFEVVLDLVLGDPRLRGVLGENGRRYVDANFRWPVIIDRYDRFAGRVMERIARNARSVAARR
jgi:glycosyltransferase involved in cell wall biosynthesis